MAERKHQMKFTVDEREYEIISKNTKACNMSISGYLRTLATNFCIINENFEAITEHTEQLAALRNVINRVVYTMQKDETCYPADIEYIINTMNDIMKSENEFLKEMRKYRKSRTIELKKYAEKTLLNAFKPDKNK